jgi:hypothetical protein
MSDAPRRHPDVTPNVVQLAWRRPAPRPPVGEQRPPPLAYVAGSVQAVQQQQQGLSAASVADCGLLYFRTLASSRHWACWADYDAECGAATAYRRQGVWQCRPEQGMRHGRRRSCRAGARIGHCLPTRSPLRRRAAGARVHANRACGWPRSIRLPVPCPPAVGKGGESHDCHC